MPLFRKRPVVIEAVQWTGDNRVWVQAFCPTARFTPLPNDDGMAPERCTIPTLEGDHRAEPGDWIIRGVKGEFYPCKPDIFATTYEPVETREPLTKEK